MYTELLPCISFWRKPLLHFRLQFVVLYLSSKNVCSPRVTCNCKLIYFVLNVCNKQKCPSCAVTTAGNKSLGPSIK